MFGRRSMPAPPIKITGAEQPAADHHARETEITVKLETAYMTLLTLPYGTTARLGLMCARALAPLTPSI